MRLTYVEVSVWLVVACVLAWPIVAARRSNARVAGAATDGWNGQRCQACGYDLCATPDRCPECGKLVPRERRSLDPERLRGDWPDAPIDVREPSATETLVVVWHAPHAIAADLLVEQLKARGVKAAVQTRQRSMRVGEYVPTGDDHAVAIWSDDAERVEVILDRFVARASRP